MVDVLVTGATTLVGGNLTRLLVARGERVRALVHPLADQRALEGLDVEIVLGKITQAHEVAQAMRGVRQVYHCASIAAMWRTLEPAMRAINLRGTEAVCLAARRQGVERLVHLSSMEAVGLPTAGQLPDESTPWNMERLRIPCSQALYDTELMVRDHIATGLDAVIVNPTYMLGPWDVLPSSGRLILAVSRRQLPGYPRGGTNFVDVRDVCAGMVATMTRGVTGQRYILGGENRSYREVIKLIAEVVGRRPPRVAIPQSVAMAAGAMGELWGGLTGREPIVSVSEMRFAYLDHYLDSQRAHDELEMPHTPLRQTVEDAWAWFVSHGYGTMARGKVRVRD